MTTLVQRAEWGARARKQGTTSIIEHPSVTFHYVGGGWEYPWDHSSCDDKVRNIQADHMDNRGWSDIAYSYLVCPHDCVYVGRGFDRRSSANGNETGNNNSFAICALWGTASADDSLPEGLKQAFLFARQILRNSGGATSVVKGHRDWKETSCPGDQIYAWIQAGLPVAGSSSGEGIDVTTDASVRKIVKDELADALEPIIPAIQAYAKAVNKYQDQTDDSDAQRAAGATDLVLRNDFEQLEQSMGQRFQSLEQLITSALAELKK